MVECLSRDRGPAGLSLTAVTALCPWASHINPSLVLLQPRKSRPFITERLLMGRKESNQTKSSILEKNILIHNRVMMVKASCAENQPRFMVSEQRLKIINFHDKSRISIKIATHQKQYPCMSSYFTNFWGLIMLNIFMHYALHNFHPVNFLPSRVVSW